MPTHSQRASFPDEDPQSADRPKRSDQRQRTLPRGLSDFGRDLRKSNASSVESRLSLSSTIDEPGVMARLRIFEDRFCSEIKELAHDIKGLRTDVQILSCHVPQKTYRTEADYSMSSQQMRPGLELITATDGDSSQGSTRSHDRTDPLSPGVRNVVQLDEYSPRSPAPTQGGTAVPLDEYSPARSASNGDTYSVKPQWGGSARVSRLSDSSHTGLESIVEDALMVGVNRLSSNSDWGKASSARYSVDSDYGMSDLTRVASTTSSSIEVDKMDSSQVERCSSSEIGSGKNESFNKIRGSVPTETQDRSSVASLESVDSSHFPSFSNPSERSEVDVIVRGCILHPESNKRAFWDVGCALMLLYDSIVLPVVMAWDPATTPLMQLGTLMTASFWSTDIIMIFNTGFYNSNYQLQTQRKKILCRYLRGTFCIDFTICFLDWLSLIMEEAMKNNATEEGFSILRVVKANRILRILGVLRVSKIWDRLERIHTHFASKAWHMTIEVLSLFLLIGWMNHVLACIWYVIGKHGPTDTGLRWLDELPSLKGASFFYEYATAYHWSITQLTPGSMQVAALNTCERAFSIAILLCGLLFCTSLVSRLSALMVQLSMAKKQQNEIVSVLRRFLRENSVTSILAERVERQIVSRLSAKKPLAMKDIPALDRLSKSLRGELKHQIFAPHLMRKPLFMMLDSIDGVAVKNLCESVDCRQFAPEDEVFSTGALGRISYLVIKGHLLYSAEDVASKHSRHAVRFQKTVDSDVETGHWISPAALWTPWKTKGTLVAVTLSELLCIDGEKISKLLALRELTGKIMSTYRQRYITLLDEQEDWEVTDLQDGVDHGMVVLSLPVTHKLQLAQPIFTVLRHRALWRLTASAKKDIQELVQEIRDEVAEGKSILVFNEDGIPVRVAMVVAVRATRSAGETLMLVGKVENHIVKPVCRLPGGKFQQNELPHNAASRILSKVTRDLKEYGKGLQVGDLANVEVADNASPSYGLLTQYKRHTFNAANVHDIEAGPPPHIKARITGHEEPEKPSRTSRRVSESYQVSRVSKPLVEDGIDIEEVLKLDMPWLQDHYPTYMHHAVDDKGSGSIYAWLHPEDCERLKTVLKNEETPKPASINTSMRKEVAKRMSLTGSIQADE